MQNSQMESRLDLHFGIEKIRTAVPSPRNFSANDPLLNILSQWFTALILFRGTKINAGLPLKTGCLRVRNFCFHSTSRQITLRKQNKRKISYRKVEEEARRIKRHVCFFVLQNIKHVFICPSCCMDYNLPARRRTYVVLLTVCFFGGLREQIQSFQLWCVMHLHGYLQGVVNRNINQ